MKPDAHSQDVAVVAKEREVEGKGKRTGVQLVSVGATAAWYHTMRIMDRMQSTATNKERARMNPTW